MISTRYMALAALFTGMTLAPLACVKTVIKPDDGLGSFRVTLAKGSGYGSRENPLPFAELGNPFAVSFEVTALNTKGEEFSWDGLANIDVRAGRVDGVGPAGSVVQLVDGIAQVDLNIVLGQGMVRIWVEDCGSQQNAGTFATGISDTIYFDAPRLDQVNATDDNTTSPMMPRADNVCAILGDPRYSIEANQDGEVEFAGYSHNGTVNAPPPAIGSFLEILGCSRAEYDTAKANGLECARGPLIVTGISNEGFYITDINTESMARGMNHLYSFTFNYPDGLEIGDMLLSLRGAPVEFTGSTQLGNPIWRKDGTKLGLDLLPKPIYLDPAVYRNSLRTYGRNEATILDLEKLEGAVVCFDDLAPAANLTLCDSNGSGSMERQGCLLSDFNAPLPPLCSDGVGRVPTPPECDETTMRDYCLPMTAEELELCGLSGYVPANAFEYCCERICYNDPLCSEKSSFDSFGQWTAVLGGNYEPMGDAAPVKIAVISRDADPSFDPMAFANAQLAIADPAQRKHIRVIGNLRQVLAARPTWVVVANKPGDIAVVEDDGPCPR